MDHADHDPGEIEDHHDRPVDQAERIEPLVDRPLRPSSTIQAKVRTRKLVQNGISTQMIKVLRVDDFTVASR